MIFSCFIFLIFFRNGSIVPLSKYQSQNQGWLSWGFGALVKKPMSWTFTKFTGWGNQEETTYVYVSMVQVILKYLLHTFLFLFDLTFFFLVALYMQHKYLKLSHTLLSYSTQETFF